MKHCFSYISASNDVVVDLREVSGNVISTPDCSSMWGTSLPQDNICFGDRERGPCSVSIFMALYIINFTFYTHGFMLDVRVPVRPSVRRSYVRPFFVSDNLSKNQWIFTKLGMCIDIVDVLFGISSNFYGVICPRHAHIFVSGR